MGAVRVTRDDRVGQHHVGTADIVGGAGVGGVALVVGERHLHPDETGEHVDEEGDGGVAGQLGDELVEDVVAVADQARAGFGLVLDDGAHPGDAVLVDVPRRQRCRQGLMMQSPCHRQLVDARAVELEVHGHGLGDHRGVGRGDHQAPARSPLHRAELVVLDQPDRLAEHRPADLVALQQVGLGPDDGAHRRARGEDVRLHAGAHLRRQLQAPGTAWVGTGVHHGAHAGCSATFRPPPSGSPPPSDRESPSARASPASPSASCWPTRYMYVR